MISYIGGKSKMAKWISGYIPNDIETYVEVFGGAFWVYINGDVHTRPKLQKVINNDFNRYMVNLFTCCSSPQNFYDSMLNIKSQNESLFNQYKSELFDDSDIDEVVLGDYDIGMKYAYIVTQVFSGLNPVKGKFIDLKGKYKSKFDSFRNRLINTEIVEKLKKIDECENMDYSEVIKKYDSPTTYFYCDPPYWKTENYYSLHDFDREDHEKLCNQLKNIQGKFSLSYYNFNLLGEWLSEDEYVWERKEFAKSASARKDVTQNKGEELMIMNYNIKKELENKLIGEFFDNE